MMKNATPNLAKNSFLQKSVKWVALATLGLSMTACLMTRDEIAEEESHKVVQQQVSTLQKTNAEQANHYTEVSEDLRNLGGRVEALENRQTQAGKDRERIQASSEQQLAEANKKITALQDEIQKLENQITYLSQEITKIETAKPAPAPAAAAAPAGKGDKKTDYYKEADEQFAHKEWKQAILNFQKYRETTPKGKRVGMATYKIGVAFQELGLKDEAKTFFDEVQTKYPDTDLAKAAKDRLKGK